LCNALHDLLPFMCGCAMLSWEQLNDSSNRFCWALGESVCPCIFSHRRMYRVSLLILLALTLFDYTYFSYEDFFALG
jgi:hypothetical protein